MFIYRKIYLIDFLGSEDKSYYEWWNIHNNNEITSEDGIFKNSPSISSYMDKKADGEKKVSDYHYCGFGSIGKKALIQYPPKKTLGFRDSEESLFDSALKKIIQTLNGIKKYSKVYIGAHGSIKRNVLFMKFGNDTYETTPEELSELIICAIPEEQRCYLTFEFFSCSSAFVARKFTKVLQLNNFKETIIIYHNTVNEVSFDYKTYSHNNILGGSKKQHGYYYIDRTGRTGRTGTNELEQNNLYKYYFSKIIDYSLNRNYTTECFKDLKVNVMKIFEALPEQRLFVKIALNNAINKETPINFGLELLRNSLGNVNSRLSTITDISKIIHNLDTRFSDELTYIKKCIINIFIFSEKSEKKKKFVNKHKNFFIRTVKTAYLELGKSNVMNKRSRNKSSIGSYNNSIENMPDSEYPHKKNRFLNSSMDRALHSESEFIEYKRSIDKEKRMQKKSKEFISILESKYKDSLSNYPSNPKPKNVKIKSPNYSSNPKSKNVKIKYNISEFSGR